MWQLYLLTRKENEMKGIKWYKAHKHERIGGDAYDEARCPKCGIPNPCVPNYYQESRWQWSCEEKCNRKTPCKYGLCGFDKDIVWS